MIDSIMKTKPTDAGDLAIGIEDIISDLRSNPAQFQEKLDHLEGLFKELAYGEEYALREKVVEEEDDDSVLGSLFGGNLNSYPFASGVIPAISGAITPGSLHVQLPVSKQITAGYHSLPANPNATPVLKSTWDDRHGEEIPLGEVERCSLPAPREMIEAGEPEAKPKPKWWKKWL